MSLPRYKESYLRISEEINALDYLEKVGEYVKLVSRQKIAWKWVVLSLHGALYGFAIVACKGSDYRSVVKTTRKGDERLINLDEALKLCKDPNWMGSLQGGLPLVLSASQEDSIRRLKVTLRNNFEHYIPCGWSIELHGLPKITIDILNIIRFLTVETFRYQHLTQTQRKRIKSIIFQAKKTLGKSVLYLESSIEDINLN